MEKALREALAFPLSKATELSLKQVDADRHAEQEAAFPVIAVGEDGLSGGMRLALLQPTRAVMAQWRHLRQTFHTALAPRQPELDALQGVEREIEDLLMKRAEEIDAVERELQQSPRYVRSQTSKERAEQRYNDFVARHRNREANMKAKALPYFLVMALIGSTEWLINYRFLYSFFRIPSFAAGTTIVLGILLALCSHEHGAVWKQWHYLFNRGREAAKRNSSARMFAISIFGLLIVIAATAGVRYVAALNALSQEDAPSALGNLGAEPVHIFRDVGISMLANIAAWLVGAIISYHAHDVDPDYMEATAQWNKAHNAWYKARKEATERLKDIEAKYAKLIDEARARAETLQANVRRELDMLKQIVSHDRDLITELSAVLATNIHVYRDALARIVLAHNGQVQIVRGDARIPMSPFDYKGMEIKTEKMALEAVEA
jgi:hypothetical protein